MAEAGEERVAKEIKEDKDCFGSDKLLMNTIMFPKTNVTCCLLEDFVIVTYFRPQNLSTLLLDLFKELTSFRKLLYFEFVEGAHYVNRLARKLKHPWH
jgi:hypothetical protein